MADRAPGPSAISRALLVGYLLAIAVAVAPPEGRPGQFVVPDADAILMEQSGVLRAMAAGTLFTRCLGIGPQALREVSARLGEYVPVLALGGDPGRPASVLALPRSCFSIDPAGRPLGLFGPRLRIELRERIAVRVDPGTWRALESVANPVRAVLPGDGGTLLGDGEASGCSLAMVTAFAVGSRVIAAAERWAGHGVDWGKDGRLAIVPYAWVTDAPLACYSHADREVQLGALGSISEGTGLCGFTGRPCAWPHPVADLFVDTAGDPDAVAHECAHAVLSALKPGWTDGMALSLHEALADTIAVLVAFEDPAVLERVLQETGGDLCSPNEAARLCEGIGLATHRYGDDDPSNDEERACRNVLDVVTVEDCGLDPDATDLPPAYAAGKRAGDPHRVSVILSGLLYEVFCAAHERAIRASVAAARAVIEAQCSVGSLMLDSLALVGEHRVSLRDFGFALLRSDRQTCGGRWREALRSGLIARGLLDATEDVDAELRRREAVVPSFELPPEVREPAEVLARVEALESAELGRAKACPSAVAALVRHSVRFPFGEEAGAGDVELCGDVTRRDGSRVLRLRYRAASDRLVTLGGQGNPSPDQALLGLDHGECDVFVSLVFDPGGRLIAHNADKPWL
jgi:hypothetical protein